MRLRVALSMLLAACLAVCVTACSTPSQPSELPTVTETPSASRADDLPEDQTISGINTHIPAGNWAFITTASSDHVAVRINTLWQGQPGELSNRDYTQGPGEASVDTVLAVPFYLSWSYVVLAGSAHDEPMPILLPSEEGSLFGAESAFADRDCPDYTHAAESGIGYMVTHCIVSLSEDNAYPIGIAIAVPDQTQQYWFLDAPAAIDMNVSSDNPTATGPPTQQPT